jgi:hypothetical protein
MKDGSEHFRLKAWAYGRRPDSARKSIVGKWYVDALVGKVIMRPSIDNRLMPAASTVPQQATPTHSPAESALEHLEEWILTRLPGNMARLVYVSSFRDFISGSYSNYGLIARFGQDATEEAMARCHRRVFKLLLNMPLPALCDEFSAFLASASSPAETVIHTWRALAIYRTIVPNDAQPSDHECFEWRMKLVLDFCQRQFSRQSSSTL